MITTSYQALTGGEVSLSGASVRAPGLAAKVLLSVAQPGGVPVHFHPMKEGNDRGEGAFGSRFAPGAEGYLIAAEQEAVHVYADTPAAALYAAYALAYGTRGVVAKGLYYSNPAVSHRSARVYMPEKKDMPYFKRFIDLLVYLGYNTLVLEIGGVMEYKRHPEINESFQAYARSMQEYNEKVYDASSVYYRTKNSVHTFNGNGDIYTQEQMRALVDYCADRHIEIIPEVPSLSHSEYFLISHPELRECMDEPFASTACPQNEALYRLVFDLFDEVIDVFRPKTLHIGHDEWWVMCVCDACKDKEAGALFSYNVNRLYDYLKSKGISTMMWADKMVPVMDKTGEVHGAAQKHVYHLKTDRTIRVLGEEHVLYAAHWFRPTPEAVEHGFHQVIHDTTSCFDQIPADVQCLNWYWSVDPRILDPFLLAGKHMIYGNCNPSKMGNYQARFAAGAKGFSVSCWLSSNETGLAFWHTLFELGYGAVIAWQPERTEADFSQNNQQVYDALYRFFHFDTLCAPRLEVVHSLAYRWDVGEAYYDLPFAQKDRMTIGSYVVKYKDGREDCFPVLYALTAGPTEAAEERFASSSTWSYSYDGRPTVTAGTCLVSRGDDGRLLYTTVFALNGEVAEVSYVPREGLEGLLTVRSITCK